MYRPLIIFDQSVTARSPAGSCVLTQCIGLSGSRPVTVFSDKCDAKALPNISWVRVALPKGPVLLRYIAFQVLARAAYRRSEVSRVAAKFVQATQGQYATPDVSYAHFCHRAYLGGAWKQSSVRGLRRLLRWTNHSLNAWWESSAFRNAKAIVVPSNGLARELARFYPDVLQKIRVIPNPVDLEHFARPVDFDRRGFRSQLAIDPGATVISFVALGDFARKGLGILIDAIARLRPPERAKLVVLVVGGQPSEIREFREYGLNAGVEDHLRFAGMRQDVRPFFWASDAFVFPSAYETFSLVTIQAAAAGLPVLVPHGLYGPEDYVVDGENGWLVERTAESVSSVVKGIVGGTFDLASMGVRARSAVLGYSPQSFVARWQDLYGELELG